MRKGFTLVELSIVLVIIGLLIGGVLKGKAMIDSTKVKRVKTDVDGIVAAVYAYQDRFGALPGDNPTPVTAGCAAGNGNGLIDTAAERICAWRDLISAGFVAGNPALVTELTVAKRSPYGGMYVFRNGTAGNRNGNFIFVDNVPSNVVQTIDFQYDDNVWNTGDIQANVAYPAAGVAPVNMDISWFAF